MAQLYSLVLEIAEPEVRRLTESRSALVLAKPASGAPPNVAWLVLVPEVRTAIRWAEVCGVYASQTVPRYGSAIVVSSLVYPAADKKVYPYAQGAFGDPVDDERIPPGNYDVRNAGTAAATFGLVQEATANAQTFRSPLNAVALAPDLTADFTPIPRLYVWLQTGLSAGTIIPRISPSATTISFDSAHPSQSYAFDGGTASFVPSS